MEHEFRTRFESKSLSLLSAAKEAVAANKDERVTSNRMQTNVQNA